MVNLSKSVAALLLGSAITLLATACQQSDTELTSHTHNEVVEYNCTPTASITATYYANQDNGVQLLIDDIDYELVPLPNESTQHTFISEVGLDAAHGMIWQVHDDHAELLAISKDNMEMFSLSDSDTATSEMKTLFDCKQQQR